MPCTPPVRSLRRAFGAAAALAFLAVASADAQPWLKPDTTSRTNQSYFRAIPDWPAANEYRDGQGNPGPKYWQQRVDYTIRTRLDTAQHRITGTARVTYHNNAPAELTYLWFQLDQNIEQPDSRAALSQPAIAQTQLPEQARRFLFPDRSVLGNTISRVQLVDARGRLTDARYLVNGTQMRVDLAAPLRTGERVQLEVEWSHGIPEAGTQNFNGRGQRELVKDGWLYEMAQWFPRAAVYDDVNGWNNDQFLGQGEFYLNFGNYDVQITVPRDHIVRATGTLTNPTEVLTTTQRQRLATAMRDTVPVFIVAADEVGNPAARPSGSGDLTWRFTAENVRDFAWASSRAFVWDAAGYTYPESGRTVEMHSVYPRDAMPLWDKVSTRAIKQTLVTYGRMAFEYPYPQASNVHGPVFGMEYPMIAFCGARPSADGTYTPALEYALVAVTIHEVGHNWFPMIVASDERKWTWMDEGLNSFLEHYASLEWDPQWPAARLRGFATNITPYMRTTDQVPIMTESDYIHTGFGPNGYAKPAAGLVMLRERILGPERFDLAFREYSTKWAFKHPQPADFFRTLASGAGDNLNYFWRGWFYSTYANDQALAKVETQDALPLTGDPSRGRYYHRITIDNAGGLVLPIEFSLEFADGSRERVRLPAETWRKNERQFVYGHFSDKPLAKVVLDPDAAYADVNRENNTWTPPVAPVP